MKLYIAENKFKLFLLNKLKDNKSSLFDYWNLNVGCLTVSS
jgi:hypothetical protein